jgi:phosphatidylserine/phosphatidylglycerophosphate/cardiolipin synthase-like enzyme
MKEVVEARATMKVRNFMQGAAIGVLLLSIVVGVLCAIGNDRRKATARGVRVGSSSLSVKFSPKGGCADAIVAEIGKAKESVLVLAYSFTSRPIFAALLEAKRRGIDVKVVVDGGQLEVRSLVWESYSNGIPTLVDCRHAIAINTVIVIDDRVVITGSFNFSAAAENSNAENLLVIRSKDVAALYGSNWAEHAGHSVAPMGVSDRPKRRTIEEQE